jgi:type VI secretion system protein ImpE
VTPDDLVKAGRVEEALTALQDAVRNDPSRADLRVFLFQLLSVLGRWDRALTQLNVAAELDPKDLLMAQVCRAALQCEALRTEVFAGKRTPLLLGEPAEWIGRLIESVRVLGQGHPDKAATLRAEAFDGAPAVSGFADKAPFEWLADTDERLGPVFEAVIEGRYYWIPMSQVAAIDIEAPTDLRDVVWTPVRFTWTNGGTAIALMPARYPGSESAEDDAIKLGRRTDFIDAGGETFVGLGQRMWATPDAELPMLQTRRIVFGPEWTDAPEELPEDAAAPEDGSDG